MEIIAPQAGASRSAETAEAAPGMSRAFWPDLRRSHFFPSRRVFLDFMRSNEGRIFFFPACPPPASPFILIGNWRTHTGITALWHVKGEGALKETLVDAACAAGFASGGEAIVTMPLGETEAQEYAKWDFTAACRITLLEKRLLREPAAPPRRNGVEITAFRKRYLDDVLSLDATAFDDFWRLDARTMQAVSTTCRRNVFLLARRSGELLGYAVGGANGRFAYLQRLGVHASHQGKGVGELLARRLISSLRGLGAASVMVNTQGDNAPALALYGKLGFESMQDSRVIMRRAPRPREGER